MVSQSSSITGASPSDCLMSYLGHLLQGSYLSAEMQSVYSTAQVDLALLTQGEQLLYLYKVTYQQNPYC